MNCCAGRIRFFRYPRARTLSRAIVPDDYSIESDCMPIYVACNVKPVPCLPCTYAELHIQNSSDAMKRAVRACQMRYFGEVWDLVFSQIFRSESAQMQSFDADSAPVPEMDADADAGVKAGAGPVVEEETQVEAEPAEESELEPGRRPGPEKKPGRKYFTISTRQVKASSKGVTMLDMQELQKTRAQKAVKLTTLQARKSESYIAGRTAPRRSFGEDAF